MFINKKSLFLTFLLIVLLVFTFLLLEKNSELEAIIYRNNVEANSKTPNLDVEFEENTMISVNAELDLESGVLKEAIVLAKSVAKDLNANNISVSEINVSDIYEVATYSENIYSNATMYNVELLVSPLGSDRFLDDSNYMILLSRWDSDNAGIYTVSCISEEELKSKYLDIANEEYDGNIYSASCSMELQDYYQRTATIKQDDLMSDAYIKALDYILSPKNDIRIQEINIDNVRVEEDSIFIFETDIEGVSVIIRYLNIKELDAWSFYYATHIT